MKRQLLKLYFSLTICLLVICNRDVVNAAKNIADDTLSSLKSALEIASPSNPPTIEMLMQPIILSDTDDDTKVPLIMGVDCRPSPLEEEVQLISLVAMAEAEGESEYGKRLVIDTILNRVDSPYFPNSVYEVVYQPNQFTSVWNGRMDRCIVTDEMRELVLEESAHRSDTEVIYFTSGEYGRYGTPAFQEGNHYFCRYE